MPKPRKMLGAADSPYIVSLMRLIETQSKATIASWCMDYYPKLGFKRARDYGLTLPDGTADDSFMAYELQPGYLTVGATLRFLQPEFELPESNDAGFEAFHKEFMTEHYPTKLTLRPFYDNDMPLMERWLYRDHIKPWYDHPLDWLKELRERFGEFRFITHMIAEPEYLRRGYAKAMIAQMLDRLRTLGAKTVIVLPDKENIASNRALIASADRQWNEMWALIASMGDAQRSAPFVFDASAGKEAHWGRDKNLRDVLVHLYEWHQLLPNWEEANQNGDNKPFLPEPYNWKTYGDMNVEFWKNHQSTTYADSKTMLQSSHAGVMALIEQFSDEELFEKKHFPWTGCYKVSDGCTYCYFYGPYSKRRGQNTIEKTAAFNKPLMKTVKGEYKIAAGKIVATCFASDFFLPEADEWRNRPVALPSWNRPSWNRPPWNRPRYRQWRNRP